MSCVGRTGRVARAVRPGGIELLNDYVTDHVFLHDDFDPSYPASDWEGYDTAPLLLGANIVAFDNPVLDRELFDRLLAINGRGDAEFLAPRDAGLPLATAIMKQRQAVDRLRRLPGIRRLSVFENRPQFEGRLSALLADVPVTVSPDEGTFQQWNDKVAAQELLQELGVPAPPGVACHSFADVKRFVEREWSAGYTVLVKAGHRKLVHLQSKDDVATTDVLLREWSYPVLAERFIPHTSSPILQVIKWRGRTEVLCASLQRHDGLRHAGNSWPFDEPEALAELTLRVADAFPDNYGVLGLDFILTARGPLVVDVNPRFCSSTYPQVAYAALEFDAQPALTGHVRLAPGVTQMDVTRSVPVLDMRSPGVLLYCPLPEPTSASVAYSYLIVGETSRQLCDMERALITAATERRG